MKNESDARREYGDIIDLPHPVSPKHPPMSRLNRAAQFSPFAALTGYDDLIRESQRETETRRTLDESRVEELDGLLRLLFSRQEPPEATFTYFVSDGKKSGGQYVSVRSRPVRFDELAQTVTLENGTVISLEDLTDVDEIL